MNQKDISVVISTQYFILRIELEVRKSNRGYAKAAIERAECDACISISEREQVRRKATAPYDTAEFLDVRWKMEDGRCLIFNFQFSIIN